MRAEPLDGRDDLRIDTDPNHPLTKALRDLVREHKLAGAVLLSFDGDRVGINSSSPSEEFGAVMERLGDTILARFDDGDFDTALSALDTGEQR